MTAPLPHIVLASASPRRREILTDLGLTFEVAPIVGISEAQMAADFTGQPHELAYHIAMQKVMIASTWHGGSLVIAADTVVVCDGQLLGKPADAMQAREYLQQLQGRSHEVITGLALHDGPTGKIVGGEEVSQVTFGPMDEAAINGYISSGEPFDKAGAYAVQGMASLYITGIRGDYFNVVGLPVFRLRILMEQLGYDLPAAVFHPAAAARYGRVG